MITTKFSKLEIGDAFEFAHHFPPRSVFVKVNNGQNSNIAYEEDYKQNPKVDYSKLYTAFTDSSVILISNGLIIE